MCKYPKRRYKITRDTQAQSWKKYSFSNHGYIKKVILTHTEIINLLLNQLSTFRSIKDNGYRKSINQVPVLVAGSFQEDAAFFEDKKDKLKLFGWLLLLKWVRAGARVWLNRKDGPWIVHSWTGGYAIWIRISSRRSSWYFMTHP